MEKQILFEKMKLLVDKLAEYRKTSTLSFENMEEKLMLKEVFKQIHPRVNPNLACDSCVINYLNLLQVYYEREAPKFYATTAKNIEAKVAYEEALKNYNNAVEENAHHLTIKKFKRLLEKAEAAL